MDLVQLRTGSQAKLERELRATLRGEVRFDTTSRALYATDASSYRQVPIGVVIPRDAQDVLETLAICRDHGAPVLPRGGGTSLAGQCCNVAVVLDFSKYMSGVLQIDIERQRARVLPGTVLDQLRRRSERYGLTFGPDPATHDHCTFGGMIGNNSCGVHAVLSEFYGPGPRVEDNVEELEVVTYDGLRMRVGATSQEELGRILAEGGRRAEIYRGLNDLMARYSDSIRQRYPDIPRRVSGYNLPELLPEHGFDVAKALVGTEGTCVTVLEATIKLVACLPARVLVIAGFRDVYAAAEAIPLVRELRPVGCEGMDDRLISFNRKSGKHLETIEKLPRGNGWLLVEFGAETKAEAVDQAELGIAALARHGALETELVVGDADQAELWELRESGFGSTAFVPGHPDTWEGWEDAAVPPDRLAAYLREFRALLDRYGYGCALYGHFAQGCVHTRIDFDMASRAGIDKYLAFTSDAADLVVSHGGSLSGEHGDGQARADLLEKMYGPRLCEAFREFKRIWDPAGKMNPGKVVDPYRRDENLRLGADYRPWHPETHFAYADDGGDFAHSALRCVGVGKCRRESGGTMCPSFMVTREELHTTRGRARLLFEMVKGDVITNGWHSEEVKESLELCLSCKGCKSDCPVSVDIATYKAEFLAHYYAGKLRPRHAYAFGLIDLWARLACAVPALANFVTHAPGISRLAKWAAGAAPEREIPRFAPQTFRRWFRDHRPAAIGAQRVVLWPDTFNNYFFPETLAAAVEVLERAGCEVIIPTQVLCCGRPLYDYGMLDRARRLWRRVLTALDDEISAGTPVIVIEPSCAAAFRDELPALMRDDGRAPRLAERTFSLAEFLRQKQNLWHPPALRKAAVVHEHCHQKAVSAMDADRELLQEMRLDCEFPNAGCCGMAGGFGYEKQKYPVSIAVGESVLLPRIRQTEAETLVVASGFSCRQQILQATDRVPLHLAEVIQLALHQDDVRESSRLPERQHRQLIPRALCAAMIALVVLLVAFGFWS